MARPGPSPAYGACVDQEAIARAALQTLPQFFGAAPRSLTELWASYAMYERVFAPEVVERARDVYSTLWATGPVLPVPDADATPRVSVATTQDFLKGQPRARAFPNGYREIATQLGPDVVWVAMRFVRPGLTTGLLFDGFVHIADASFAWFPKPWKTLARIPTVWSHWSE